MVSLQNISINCEDIESKVIKFIQKSVKNAGLNGAVVAASGGIDSAVVATLCVKALGKKRVFALLMPERGVTKRKDVEDACHLAEKLGISYEIRPINNILDALFQNYSVEKIAYGNAKARIRMMILYTYANSTQSLVVGTGNKSELREGYFTKYGDGGVDFLPIADLYKSDVVQLASFLDISQSIIDKPPSAGLWHNQTDEGEMGLSYAELDCILQGKANGSAKSKIEKVKLE